jgi:predicted DCC family thiol-disulfide oxidoreductase YuxK
MKEARWRQPDWLRGPAATVFGLDLRSLALFRALLGLVVLVDALRRLCDARAFYTDAGVMPRQWLAAFGEPDRISLHLANGQAWFAAGLLLLQALAALFLALGWRTRLAALLCFALEVSLLNRAPLLLGAGDSLLACLLFWSLFLPLGARASVDAALAPRPPLAGPLHLSWASAALVLQVACVFFFGALALRGAAWHPPFTALADAVQRDAYTAAAGRWLRPQSGLLAAVSAAVLYLQLWGPLLLLSPLLNRPLRLAAMLLLGILEIVLALLFVQRMLPVAALVALSALTGTWVWDGLARRRQRHEARHGPLPLRIFYDGDCAPCLKLCLLLKTLLVLPRAELLPAQEQARARTLFEANGSWVVIDHDDHAYLKWPALTILLRRSPVLKWLGWPLAGAWTAVPGNAAYDFIGRHRRRLGRALDCLLPYRQPGEAAGHVLQWLAAFAMVLVLAWNLAAAGALPAGLGSMLAPPLKLLRLDQSWDWYTPLAARDDGWFVFPGELADGSAVDVLRPESGVPAFDKPRDVAHSYADIRWHSFQEKLLVAGLESIRPNYGDYLCRRWNARNPAAKALLDFKMVYLLEPPHADSTAPAVEQRILWRQQCAAPAAAAVPPRAPG